MFLSYTDIFLPASFSVSPQPVVQHDCDPTGFLVCLIQAGCTKSLNWMSSFNFNNAMS